jgi:pimeloyl-ACP methyl ester carboxylesterase
MVQATQSDEIVVLVHGIAAPGFVMRPLGRRLRRAGFATEIWTYPSLFGSIERHGAKLRERLQAFDADTHVSRIHLATHSMGSIVARQAMLAARPRKMGRWVMLAPPNRGSAVASILGPRLRWCFPTIDQLADRPDSFVNRLAEPQQLEIGIIAAQADLQVAVASTCLACQRDHIVIGGLHSQMLLKSSVAGEIVEFLRQGRFTDANRRDFVCGPATGVNPGAS